MDHRVSFPDNKREILLGWQIKQMESGPSLPSFDPKAGKPRHRPNETGAALMESAVRFSTEKSSFRSRRCLVRLKPPAVRPCHKKVYVQDWQRILSHKHTQEAEDKKLRRLNA